MTHALVTAASICLASLLCPGQCVPIHGHAQFQTNTPVIGIVAQRLPQPYHQQGIEYIDANYVKFLEMAGAKVVAIRGHQPDEYYQQIFKQINGVLFPGGSVNLTDSECARVCHKFFTMAINANGKGDYFPVWGTCQGFEMLTVFVAGGNLLANTDSENMTVPLRLVSDYRGSKLLAKAPAKIINYLTEEPVAANFHHYSLLSKTFSESKSLVEFFRPVSFNEDRKGKEFVSTFEAFKYPIYGVQWHPEKNVFMWETDKALDHSPHAVKVAQYFADFIVDEARKNSHKFKSDKEESKAIVENDKMLYVPKTFYQAYFYNVTSL